MTDRQARTEAAMGQAMYELFNAMPEAFDEQNANPFSSMMEQVDKREEQLKDLSDEERVLMKELCSIFDSDHIRSSKMNKKKLIGEVTRAKDIIEEVGMNVNFPVLPYGETLLCRSIYHSLDMVKMLIEKEADVNIETDMGECALDALLEMEEDADGNISDETKAMKELILSKGAKTCEERWMDKADEVRQWANDNKN